MMRIIMVMGTVLMIDGNNNSNEYEFDDQHKLNNMFEKWSSNINNSNNNNNSNSKNSNNNNNNNNKDIYNTNISHLK